MFSSEGKPALMGRARLIRLSEFPPSKDLWAGRSKTRKDGSGGFSTSSRAFPEDFRRGNALGSLMGMETVVHWLYMANLIKRSWLCRLAAWNGVMQGLRLLK